MTDHTGPPPKGAQRPAQSPAGGGKLSTWVKTHRTEALLGAGSIIAVAIALYRRRQAAGATTTADTTGVTVPAAATGSVVPTGGGDSAGGVSYGDELSGTDAQTMYQQLISAVQDLGNSDAASLSSITSGLGDIDTGIGDLGSGQTGIQSTLGGIQTTLNGLSLPPAARPPTVKKPAAPTTKTKALGAKQTEKSLASKYGISVKKLVTLNPGFAGIGRQAPIKKGTVVVVPKKK